MPQAINITGQRFGQWLALKPTKERKGNFVVWLCLCLGCNRKLKVNSHDLKHGRSRQCIACWRKGRTKHGHAKTNSQSAEYSAYQHAKSRCENKNDKAWKYYGGNGVKFLFTSFEHFMRILGARPTPKHSLGRILDRGNYVRGNCFWMTRKQQAIAKKNNHFLCVRNLQELKILLQEN